MSKKQFLVSKVKRDRAIKGVEVDGTVMDFSKSGDSFLVSDPGVAKALDQAVGHDGGDKTVIVSEVPTTRRSADGVHRYTFSLQRLGDWKSRIDWGHK